jgi:serine/threonine protein kinase
MPLDARTDVFSAGIILHEMLTTEKLFRGDTEFALMEKVRKAEIPLPSDFNRRVTAELDAITVKALARDVADRYQSAAQLAADLDALIGSYRFDPKELRQLLRQLFRKEYAHEVEDTQLALDASMTAGEPTPRSPAASGPLPIAGTPPDPVAEITLPIIPPIAGGRGELSRPSVSALEDGKPRGFWGSLFKKRK